MKAVILAARRSERLGPFTETRPKTLLWAAGRTLLEAQLEHLRKAGIEEVLVVVNHCQERIRSLLAQHEGFGLRVECIVQEPVEGIGDALLCCREMLADAPFLLLYGDIAATGEPISQVLRCYAENGGAVAALALPQDSAEFGNVYLTHEMRITRFLERPSNPKLANHVLAGVFVLPPRIFALLERHKGNITLCYQQLTEEGVFSAALWEGGWLDIRRPWQLLELNRMFMDTWQHSSIHASLIQQGSVQISGPVYIAPQVTLCTGAVIRGPCYIGRGSFIGNQALIRSYACLGPGTVVGSAAEIKNSVLFGDTIVGRLSYVADSILGESVRIGVGVITVNVSQQQEGVPVHTEQGITNSRMRKLGALIGDHVVIGARHVLPAGARFKPHAVLEDLVTASSIL